MTGVRSTRSPRRDHGAAYEVQPMRIAFASLVLPIASSWTDPAQADPYRWCADYGMAGSGAVNCYFVTLAQCQAAVSGVGGYCKPNPFYDGLPVNGQSAPRRGRPRY